MKQILVAFDEQMVGAVLIALAEHDAVFAVRLYGMGQSRAPKEVIEYTEKEKDYGMKAYDAVVRAIKGLREPGQ
jgi:hypothetical protein